MRNLNRNLLALGLAVAAMFVAMPLASADRVSKRIEAKTKAAMEEYDMMEFERAKGLLLEAISVGEKNDARGPELANAYLSLGVVYFSGLGEEASAKEAFGNALAINDQVEIDVSYSTPEMVELLGAANGQAGRVDDCEAAGLQHRLIDEARAGSAPEIRATLVSSLDVANVYMFYRPEGQLEFTRVAMKKSGKCGYTSNIPAKALQGEFVHYYIAAVDKAGKEIERKGSSGSPNIIEVSAATSASLLSGDDNPLGATKRRESVLTEKKASVFLSFAIGSGSGYVTGLTEKTKSDVECCFAPALLHLMPEIGFYLSSQTSISAAFRMGFPLGANVDGHATFAPAGLLRLRYALSSSGEGVMVSGALGAGLIRNTVVIKDEAADMDTDTTAMGPLLLGGGIGYGMSLGGPMRLVAEVNALAALKAGIGEIGTAVPENGVQFDANLAVLVAF